jgi:iron only hydrogenase large subunit-like protein
VSHSLFLLFVRSGCVTSAETVLISQQSSVEFMRVLSGAHGSKAVVVGLSPQSLASLAAAVGLPTAQTQRALRGRWGSRVVVVW